MRCDSGNLACIMKLHLRVEIPGKAEQLLRVTESVLVGRDEEAPLRIISRDVSRRHCRFIVQPQGVLLKDLGSRNGTLLNGERVEQKRRIVLSTNDVIEVGPVKMTVRIVSEGKQQNRALFESELFSLEALESSAGSEEESSHDTLIESRLVDSASQFKLDAEE